MPESGTETEMWVVLTTAFGSALLGALVGFMAAIVLERRRERRHGRTVVGSIVFEMALLRAALQEVVINKTRTRDNLRRDSWDRYGAEVINYLPQHLAKALYLLYLDDFDKIRTAYDLAGRGQVGSSEWPEFGATLLGWAYRAERLQQLIQSFLDGRSRWFGIPASLKIWGPQQPDQEKFKETIGDLSKYAAERVQEQGYPTDTEVRVRVSEDTVMYERKPEQA